MPADPHRARRPIPNSLPEAVRATLLVARFARAAQFVEPLLFLLVAVGAGLGTGVASVALLAHHGGVALGTLAAGALADKAGARLVTAAGLATSAGSIVVLASASGEVLLIAGSGLYGLAAATWRLALETGTARALASGAPSAESDESARLRGHAFGALVAARTIGALASGIALAAGIGFDAALLAQAGLTAVAAVLALAALPAGGAAAPPDLIRPRGTERALWLIALATVPGVLVVFQAFAGLAAVYDEDTFRWMVLLNAAVLVGAQGPVERVARRVDGATMLAGATMLVAVGMAGAALPEMPFVLPTVVWSVGELGLFATLPAVVTGLAPDLVTGRYQSRVAIIHALAAAAAAAAGPLLVEGSRASFAIAALACGALGAVAIRAVAPAIGAALAQPVGCPCGALRCRCDEFHLACAAGSPQIASR